MELFTARFLLSPGRPPLEAGALLVRNGLIEAVGPRQELAAAHPGAAAVDFGDCVLLPPLANVHTHLELTDFPAWSEPGDGNPSEADFVDWIRLLVKVRKARSEADFRTSLRHGLALSLAGGVGIVGDILTSFSAAEAYRRSPLHGRVFCEVLGRDSETAAARLAALSQLLDAPCAANLSWGLAPHAPYSLSAGTAARLGSFARERSLQIALHLAETAEEIDFLAEGRGPLVDRLFAAAGWQPPAAEEQGLSPVAWAMRHNLLQSGSLVVHGVHIATAEIDRLAAARCSIALCPRSNSLFGTARAPIEAFRRAGINLALGTDSLASAPSLSIWEEIAFARSWFAGTLSPAEWLEAATLGGARALQLDRQLGSFEAGKEASFQVVRAPGEARAGEVSEALCSLGAAVRVEELYLAGRPVLPVPEKDAPA